MLMKKYFKALITMCVFVFSLINSTLNVNALDEIFYTLSNSETEIDQSEILRDDLIISTEYLPDLSYAYNKNSFKYYDQLNDNNKSAYDSMKTWLNPTTEEITVTFPDILSYQTDSLDMGNWSEEEYNNFWNYVFGNIRFGKDALMFDYPEIFWIDESRIEITLSSVRTSRNILTGVYTMKISELTLKGGVKEEYTDIAGAEKYQSLLESSVESFEAEGSDIYHKVKYIHDYIADKVSYNMDAPYNDSAVGLFCEPYEIVCEGYSKAFKLLCDKYEIPCIVVPGNIDIENNIGHMWNYVKMEDGEWYGVDCTWDDTDSASNPVRYNYFLKGSESFNLNHTPDTEYYTTAFTYPELCPENYIYIVSQPLTTTVTNTVTTYIVITSVSTENTTVTTDIVITNVSTENTTVTDIVTTNVSATETTFYTETTEITTDLKGDYNTDGKINSADLVALRSFLLGLNPVDMEFPDDDMNEDNIINIFDYIILSRKILGGI